MAVTAVLVLAGAVGYMIWSSASADSRRYPNSGNALAVPAAHGSMEDALALFGIAAPCDATDVGYRDDRPVVGSGGTLHLRFSTSKACLGTFLKGLKTTAPALRHSTPADAVFPFAGQDRATYAEDFGWTFTTNRPYAWQVTQSSQLVQSTVVIDDGGTRPVVYLVADRSEPE
jgi:hypothetical protein